MIISVGSTLRTTYTRIPYIYSVITYGTANILQPASGGVGTFEPSLDTCSCAFQICISCYSAFIFLLIGTVT